MIELFKAEQWYGSAPVWVFGKEDGAGRTQTSQLSHREKRLNKKGT